MQTLTVPSLQGTSRFSASMFSHRRKTRKTLDREEPFSPPRSNAGQKDSAAKINRLINELKNGQLVTL
jgi:hypothetical protein